MICPRCGFPQKNTSTPFTRKLLDVTVFYDPRVIFSEVEHCLVEYTVKLFLREVWETRHIAERVSA